MTSASLLSCVCGEPMSLLSGVFSRSQAGHTLYVLVSATGALSLLPHVYPRVTGWVYWGHCHLWVSSVSNCPVNLGMWPSSCACTSGVPGLPRPQHRGPWRLRHTLAALELWNHLAPFNSTPRNSKCLTSHPCGQVLILEPPAYHRSSVISVYCQRQNKINTKQTLNSSPLMANTWFPTIFTCIRSIYSTWNNLFNFFESESLLSSYLRHLWYPTQIKRVNLTLEYINSVTSGHHTFWLLVSFPLKWICGGYMISNILPVLKLYNAGSLQNIIRLPEQIIKYCLKENVAPF